MDISKIEIGYIESCAYFYEVATEYSVTDPVSASAKDQRKARKWLEKNFISRDLTKKELSEYIGKQVSDKDFFVFLYSCYKKLTQLNEGAKEAFDKAACRLSDDVREALGTLLEFGHYFKPFSENGKDLSIITEEAESFRRVLTLIDADRLPDCKFDSMFCKAFTFDEQSNRYRLDGVIESWEDSSEKDFSITFSDARTDTALKNALSTLNGHSAWDILIRAASDILYKCTLNGNFFNEKEKSLLSLLADMSKLTPFLFLPEGFNSTDLPVLQEYLTKYNYSEPLSVLRKINITAHEKKRERLTKKLVALLNRKEYEPLWREIYALISDSQQNYPDTLPVICNKDIIGKTRKAIQKQMEANGYSGSYPDFTKKGSIKGLHTVTSNFNSYIVGAEKNVVFHIHCSEISTFDMFAVEFYCGTQLLKKDETPGDIYSCLFNAGGRRLINNAYFTVFDSSDPLSHLNDPAEFADIAVKKAELKKLTKAERKKSGTFKFPLLKIFLFCLFGAGLAFGLLLTLGMMLLVCGINLIDGNSFSLTPPISDVFWLKCFLFASLGFGGGTGIFAVLAFKK